MARDLSIPNLEGVSPIVCEAQRVLIQRGVREHLHRFIGPLQQIDRNNGIQVNTILFMDPFNVLTVADELEGLGAINLSVGLRFIGTFYGLFELHYCASEGKAPDGGLADVSLDTDGLFDLRRLLDDMREVLRNEEDQPPPPGPQLARIRFFTPILVSSLKIIQQDVRFGDTSSDKIVRLLKSWTQSTIPSLSRTNRQP